MTEYPAPLARLIQELCKLPGIGEKTAGRLAFYILKADKRDNLALSESIGKLKEEIGLCPTCFGLSEVAPGTGEATQCKVCRDPRRDRHNRWSWAPVAAARPRWFRCRRPFRRHPHWRLRRR